VPLCSGPMCSIACAGRVGWATREGGLSPADAEFIRSRGARHPLRLQVAAWHLFEAERVGGPDFAELEEQIQSDMATMLGQE
jgi:hypothetical protein